MKVYEIMNSNVKTLTKEKTILDAIKLMKDEHLDFVIISENNKALGIITDHDILILLAKELSTSTNICKVMKKYIITITDDEEIEIASDLMGQTQVKNLVVLNDSRDIVGILGLKDMAKNPFTEEYAFQAFVEISYDYSTNLCELDNIKQISAFIF